MRRCQSSVGVAAVGAKMEHNDRWDEAGATRLALSLQSVFGQVAGAAGPECSRMGQCQLLRRSAKRQPETTKRGRQNSVDFKSKAFQAHGHAKRKRLLTRAIRKLCFLQGGVWGVGRHAMRLALMSPGRARDSSSLLVGNGSDRVRLESAARWWERLCCTSVSPDMFQATVRRAGPGNTDNSSPGSERVRRTLLVRIREGRGPRMVEVCSYERGDARWSK